MFYYNEHGKKVRIFNHRPRNLSAGGLIKGFKNHRTNHKDDTINSLLEYGSLVVPVPVMKAGFMDDYDGKVVGPPTKDKKKLSRTIVMPDELVVNRRYADKVERFLKRKGITLPLGDAPLPSKLR